MLTDGALRMLVLLHFHTIGFTPIQLSYLFLLYEFAGIITNLYAGWIAKKIGLSITLYAGLIYQIISLLALSKLDQNWSALFSLIFVMVFQGLSGIAKDLTKMSSKSSVKLLAPSNDNKLFKWVTVLTGSKNTIKGLGFFVGGLLLIFLGYENSLEIMCLFLILIFIFSVKLMPKKLGQVNKETKFKEVFSTKTNINKLSLARFFLFGARDVWFVVALPIFLYSIISDGSVEKNKEAFFIIGSFLASWVILYGVIQASTYRLLNIEKNKLSMIKLAKDWALYIFPVPIVLYFLINIYPENIQFNLIATIIVLLIFAFSFAINSSLHSFLILEFTSKDRVTMDVGFYYMANASGRLIGTLMSGICYSIGGIEICLFFSALMLLFNRLSIGRISK